ncbi:hypothetical protein GGR56DRAFT_688792 [Xylariaceae sp. FL0804]|nr:hypothetical protein GGR56DRAFT_688792 [Xylariaceae sp. FL0804]
MASPQQSEATPSPAAAVAVTASGRIKRNTACTSCRDAKVRCHPSSVPGQPCQRCAKLHLACLVDRTHKRVKLDELALEIQSIRQSVGPSPAQSREGRSEPRDAAPLGHGGPDHHHHRHHHHHHHHHQDLPPVAAGAIPSASIGPPPVVVPTHHTPPGFSQPTPSTTTTTTLLQDPPPQPPPPPGPALPRALGSHPFSGEDIDFYFAKFFECYHPHMPILRERDPNRVYDASPLLFWAVLLVACRRYARGGGNFSGGGAGSGSGLLVFLMHEVRAQLFAALGRLPLSMPTLNAVLLVVTWIFPDVRFINDPSSFLSGVVGNAALLLGIHTGRGANPEFSHGVFRNSFSDEEAACTWAGHNITAQRVASYLGVPPLGPLFNQAVQNMIDGRTPFHVPPSFRVQLECQKFCNRLSKTMAAYLEESRGVPAHVVKVFEDEWDNAKGLICSERADDMDSYNALLVQLEIQIFYMLPPPGYDAAGLRRHVLRTYSTAASVVRAALALDESGSGGNGGLGFLRHLPHFHFRSLLAAGCVIYKLLRSSYMPTLLRLGRDRDRDGATAASAAALQSAADVIAVCRRATVLEDDIAMRLAALMTVWLEATTAAIDNDGDGAGGNGNGNGNGSDGDDDDGSKGNGTGPNASNAAAATAHWWQEEPVSTFSHRLSASVTFDCLMRWKGDPFLQQYKSIRNSNNNNNNDNNDSYRNHPATTTTTTTTAAAATSCDDAGWAEARVGSQGEAVAAAAVDPLHNIDWTFMDDFDWDFGGGGLPVGSAAAGSMAALAPPMDWARPPT